MGDYDILFFDPNSLRFTNQVANASQLLNAIQFEQLRSSGTSFFHH